MRLTFPRAALVAFILAVPLVPLALAQDQSQPSSAEPSAPPTSSSEQPSSAPATDQLAPSAPLASPGPDKHPRTTEEIYQDLNFFGDVFDRIRSEYVDPPDEQALIRAAIQGMLT